MSDNNQSGSDSQTESEYDPQTETTNHLQTETPSTRNETHGSSATRANVIPMIPTPSKSLAEYAKGTFNPSKPLFLYATKMTGSSTQPKLERKRGGTRHWKCNICGHSWAGSYSRLRMHLLGVGGKGVSICSHLTMLQKSELLRMQMAADAKGMLSSKNIMAQAYENFNEATSSKKN